MSIVDGLSFEFTKDPELLQQYCELRAHQFTRAWDLTTFPVAQDAFDRAGDTLIVTAAGRLIAGGRLCLSTPENPQPLPMETPEFLLRDLLPDLRLREVAYTEYGRIAILPEYRTGELSLEMSRWMLRRSLLHNASYIFWVSPLVVTRNYRKIARMLGVPCRVLTDIPVPDRESYEQHKMLLTVAHLHERVRVDASTAVGLIDVM